MTARLDVSNLYGLELSDYQKEVISAMASELSGEVVLYLHLIEDSEAVQARLSMMIGIDIPLQAGTDPEAVGRTSAKEALEILFDMVKAARNL